MKRLMITVGNFFFRWRDTAFSLIFLAALILLASPRPGYWTTAWFGAIQEDEICSLVGGALVGLGIVIRALVIGFTYVKRAGERKKIHADELYRHGLFAHSRNPLYAGNLLVVTGAIATVNLVLYWYIMLPFFYFVYYSIILAEEEFLSKKFGREYHSYMYEVNRLIPGNPGRLRESFRGMKFLLRRVVKVEYGSTTLVLASLILANLFKFRFRYGIPLDDFREQALLVLLGVVILYGITAATLKSLGKLEWNTEN